MHRLMFPGPVQGCVPGSHAAHSLAQGIPTHLLSSEAGLRSPLLIDTCRAEPLCTCSTSHGLHPQAAHASSLLLICHLGS